MICFPNAKINLGLSVIEKRSDGFHNLQSLFVPTGPYDILEFIEDKEDSFTLTGNISGINGDNNIVLEALDLLRKNHTIPPLQIHLHKSIPAGAGLGGGSSDAAFFLNYVNTFFNIGLSESTLKEYAFQLGSDCPFFILNKPAYAYSRGEILEVAKIPDQRLYIQIFNPGIHISTKEAYSKIIPRMPEKAIKEIIGSGIVNWKHQLKNDFEENAFSTHPELAEIKERLYSSGAIYSSMTGSGSTIYGIFENKRNRISEKLKPILLWEGGMNF